MRTATDLTSTRFSWAAPLHWLRAGCVAFVVGMAGCGGGGDDSAPTPSMPAPAPDAGTQPPPAPAALVVGTALSIDGGASGNPVSLRVARSANGDGFAVWLAHDGTRHNLWANRYRAEAAAWGTPIHIESVDTDIDDFDLTADPAGHAVVAWHEVPADPFSSSGMVMSARFDSGSAAWATPVPLSNDARVPRVASDANGAVLAVYAWRGVLIRGRFFDPVSGTWQPEASIEQNGSGTGFSFGPSALLDGSGNALAAWTNGRASASIVASNYFSRSTGDWVFRLAPGDFDVLGAVPDSRTLGSNDSVQLAATGDGEFLVVWQATPFDDQPDGGVIRMARFTSATHTWGAAQTLVPSSGLNLQLQRIGHDGAGHVTVLFTESAGMRTALKAIRVFDTTCSAIEVIDRAVGGGAARADLGVDALGHALAIWQQFEGGRADDGSRSNIAINRFDAVSGSWTSAVLAETEPGNAIDPSASVTGTVALLGWIQSEGGVNRVKALLQPLVDASVGQ